MNKEIIQKLKNHISAKELTDFTVELCSKNTVNPPGNEYLVKNTILKRFKKMGLKTKIYEKMKGRTNVVGVIGKGSPVVAVLGHMDTVPVAGQPWKTDPFKPVIKNGKIFARGAQDSKGSSVAAYLGAQAFLKVNPKFNGTLYVLATADEERGDVYGMDYLLQKGLKFDYALVPDAGHMGTSIYGEMGVLLVDIYSTGKAAHGSMPELGYNAIYPLTLLFNKLYKYDWESVPYDKKNFQRGAVLNIGEMNGGIADNIVPDKAKLGIMWRYPLGMKKEDLLRVLGRLIEEVKKEAKGAKISYKVELFSIPFVSDLNSKIAVSFKNAAKDLGMPMRFKTMSAQTTAKSLYHNGSQVIMHYPESPEVEISHMPNEYVEISNLEKASLLYALTLHKLFDNN